MDEIIIIWLVSIAMIGIFGMSALKMWYNLKREDKISRQVNGLLTDMSKLKGQLKRISTIEVPSKSGGISDLSNMTMEGAAEMLGISKKELNNPILKPVFEKIFNQVKSGQIAQTGKENQEVMEGY